MSLSIYVSILVENLLHLNLAPRWNFAEIFGIRKLESTGYRMSCLCDSTFSRFGTVPAYGRRTDRQTDKQTDGQTDIRRQHIALA